MGYRGTLVYRIILADSVVHESCSHILKEARDGTAAASGLASQFFSQTFSINYIQLNLTLHLPMNIARRIALKVFEKQSCTCFKIYMKLCMQSMGLSSRTASSCGDSRRRTCALLQHEHELDASENPRIQKISKDVRVCKSCPKR